MPVIQLGDQVRHGEADHAGAAIKQVEEQAQFPIHHQGSTDVANPIVFAEAGVVGQGPGIHRQDRCPADQGGIEGFTVQHDQVLVVDVGALSSLVNDQAEPPNAPLPLDREGRRAVAQGARHPLR